jgi:hypothetical protein
MVFYTFVPLQPYLLNHCISKEGKLFLKEGETIYLIRSGNFRNNQIMLDIYIMGVEARIEMDNVDETFLNERMTVAFETLTLAVRKLYYDILNFKRTNRKYMSVEERVNEILAFAKEVEKKNNKKKICIK